MINSMFAGGRYEMQNTKSVIKDWVVAARSYRRFDERKKVGQEQLDQLVELARLSGSASNLQPLKYVTSNSPAMNARIFPTLAWAGYLKDWGGPKDGERPAGYVVILLDTKICEKTGCDHGIASQNIMLGAAEMGLGGCLVGSVEREKLAKILGIPDHLHILLVIALGYPAEKVVLEDADANGCVKYYRDAEDVHHVPKRKLNEVLVKRL